MPIRSIEKEVSKAKKSLENLSVGQLELEMAANDDLLLLDIREIQEQVDLGTIPGAKHAPRGMLEFWADPASPYYRDYFSEDKRIILFCAAGGRSALATKALKDMGYSNVAHLESGFNGWKRCRKCIENVAAKSRWTRKAPKSQ